MKIGIDISQIIYQGTGVATYTRSLVDAIARVDKDNQYVLFGSSLRNKKALSEYAVNLPKNKFRCRFSFLPPKLLEFLWNWVHIVPVENIIGKVDVFHSSDWLQPPSRAKKITTIHDLAVFKYPETFKSKGGHNIVTNQKRKLFFTKQECNLIIAVSQTTKNDAVEILKIPEKKIRVIYEAADPIYFPRSKEKINKVKEKYNIAGEYFLCVGTREPRKNLDRVIMAFAEISSQYPSLSVLIVGRYGWGDDLNSKYKIHNTKVKLLGFVESEDLAGLYSGAMAFVYPSLYEGFGLPILEAMSCSCPVITSNVGSMKELAGGFAVLIDPESIDSIGSGMLKLLKDNNLRDQYKTKGLIRAREFNWDKTAFQTIEAYRSLLD